jgi:glycosyltransferase involved in cell wall biosynthesis
VKICIITHKFKKGDGQELAKHSHVNWVSIPVDDYPTEFLRNFIFTRKSAAWLKKHRREVDLIKVNGAITTGAADVNAVHFVHSSWLKSPVHISRVRRDLYGCYQWLYTALNAQGEKRAFRQAKVVVAVSEKVAKELINIGVPREKIRVIVNGVDLNEFQPGQASRTALGLPENVNLALFAGDIRTPRKNLDTVLQALVRVPDLHLAVVGKTEGSPFPELAANLGIEERVHFLGFRRDIAEIMRSVDLFVFPSRYEACTLVLLEAMASGLPVITATATGGAELVTPEAGIVLLDTDDIHALASALSTLNSDGLLRQQMAIAARFQAEQYSWIKMAETYMDLFEELISNEKHSSHPHLSPSSGSITLPYGTASAN